MRRQPHRRQAGAALLILLLILILGSAGALVTRLDKSARAQAQAPRDAALLGPVIEALLGYALETGCLPCPARSASDGRARTSCTTPAQRVGFVPWASLGTGALDHWQHRLRYSVAPAFAGTACPGFTQSTTGDIRVQTRNAAGALVDLDTGVPAAVVAHGRNGFGATLADGNSRPNPPAANVDERSNRFNATRFVQRPILDSAAVAGGPYDDLVAWLPLATLVTTVDRVRGLPP